MKIKEVASVAHELNRAYCTALGDNSQLSWAFAHEWQRKSAVAQVVFIRDNPDANDGTTHESWVLEKVAAGWVLGEVKDAEKKTHPCLVPFEDLPLEQQIKDRLFRQTVHALLPLLTDEVKP